MRCARRWMVFSREHSNWTCNINIILLFLHNKPLTHTRLTTNSGQIIVAPPTSSVRKLASLRLSAGRATSRLRLGCLGRSAQEHDGQGGEEQRELDRESAHRILEERHVEVNRSEHDHREHERTLSRVRPQRRVAEHLQRADNLRKLVSISRRTPNLQRHLHHGQQTVRPRRPSMLAPRQLLRRVCSRHAVARLADGHRAQGTVATADRNAELARRASEVQRQRHDP